jgi:aminoglycoside phosphotransferase (APT) family kinase protein
MARVVVPADVVHEVSIVVGAPVRVVGPTAGGESGSTFDIDLGGVAAILKLSDDGPDVPEDQRRLMRLVASLRARGYPAPEYLGVGSAGPTAFTVQRRLPGELVDPGSGQRVSGDLMTMLLPELLDVIELQRDAGDLAAPPWPTWLIDTIHRGGDGYCLHATMQERPDTAAILDQVRDLTTEHARGPVRTGDIVHFDLSPANVLHDRGRLSGVIDWNVPFAGASQGDRGFDLATLLFYTYDIAAVRDRLWDAATAVSGIGWTIVYLSHLVLRQVEWSVRHRPGSPEATRFITLATAILDDCGRLRP